jgi:hypothetical protein
MAIEHRLPEVQPATGVAVEHVRGIVAIGTHAVSERIPAERDDVPKAPPGYR